jgi:DNA invertase Pin-like site-specific DNA recombinase
VIQRVDTLADGDDSFRSTRAWHACWTVGIMRIAIYARVSTLDQQPENQLLELRRYAEARGWRVVAEHIDHGVSGAKERRPALDALRVQAKRRQIDGVLCWRLDRLGRNLRHLILLLDELQALGVAFVSLAEGIDATTPAGKLQLHILGAIAEFERGRIQERVMAGLARARARGQRLGRPRLLPLPVGAPRGLTVRAAAQAWGVSKSTAARRLLGGLAPVGATASSPPERVVSD